MPDNPPRQHTTSVPAPSRHELAGLIWLAVFPTLSVLNMTLGAWLRGTAVLLRTFVLATVAVPVVMYALMPLLLRIRARLLARPEPRAHAPADA